MKNFTIHSFFLLLVLLLGVTSVQSQSFVVDLKMATDAEYPDNNMIGFKSKTATGFTHHKAFVNENASGKYDFTILPGNSLSDTILVKDVNLLEMMPSIPKYVKSDPYLSFITLLNQEWNRIQVKFNSKAVTAKGSGTEKNVVTRVDVSNNCLAKGLWEILFFTNESNNDVLYFQCWFDFPDGVYNELFKKRNGVAIGQYDAMLKSYSHEKTQRIDLNKLRKVTSEKAIAFNGQNNELYPLKGERETKAKNIIYPSTVTSINDLLTDKTTFATFAAPGRYTKSDPRKTELSRFQKLNKATLGQTVSTNAGKTATNEFQLFFSDNTGGKSTKLVIGGLQLDKLPVLSTANLHKGWQRPMGVSNHSFYNSADDINGASSLQNPYFAFLIDENGNWVDSHDVGIDGVLLYRDEADPNKVNLFILAFERHAFVGHFVFDIPKAATPASGSTDADKKLIFSGDMRARLVEHDWDVTTADGKTLDPRTRFRVRLRFGFNYTYNQHLSFGARIRTGSANEQQSPHVTLGALENANLPIGLDRAFVKYNLKGLNAWAGKNSWPFYSHDDLFITQDISPEGLYGEYMVNANKNLTIKPSGGFFIINSSGKSLKRDRTLRAAQLLATQKSSHTELNVSTGFFQMDSLGNTPDGTASFPVNYHLSVTNAKFTYFMQKLPISIAGNLMKNLAELSGTEIKANNHQDQKTGYTATLELGQLKAAKDFLFSVTYAHIEKYAVLDYFAQDDWMRWGFSGGAGGTRGSNFKGFEFRAGYSFGPKCNLIARAYFIDGIAPNKPGAVLETNNRFRLDMNIGF